MFELFEPDVEFVTLLLGNHRGKEAVRLLFEENRANISGYGLAPEELIDAGHDVIAVVRLGGAGRASGIATSDQIAFPVTIENGLVLRQPTFRNKQAAREAAGLSE